MADDYGSMSARKAKSTPARVSPTSKSGNYDQGSQGGFGSGKGARNKRHLKNDSGMGGGKWRDTDNDISGEGHGSGSGARVRPGGGGY